MKRNCSATKDAARPESEVLNSYDNGKNASVPARIRREQ